MRDSLPDVLILDDDASIREALAAALKHVYMVHVAATVDEACAILQRYPIAAIVLDVMLGRENSLDFVERFRALSQAPFLILTGHGSEEVAVRALRAKASNYLKKPVNLLELRAALARLMPPADLATDPIERARNVIRELPDRVRTTQSLARQVGLSDRHLRRRFFEVYGKTPQRYVTEVRMERATDLLCTTSLGIKQIALQVGFHSLVWFCRLFKHVHGLTPSEFRSRHREPEDRGPRGGDSSES